MQWITALDFQILHEIQNRFSCSFLDFWETAVFSGFSLQYSCCAFRKPEKTGYSWVSAIWDAV